MTEQNLTGYPSIDKPWLKYYGEHFDPQDIPDMSIYQLAVKYNQNRMNSVALDIRSSANGYRKGIKITYHTFFNWIHTAAKALAALGVGKDEIVPILLPNIPEAPSRLDGAVTPPLIQLRPDIPNNFAAAIDKAIEILPQNRFQTMREFMHAAEGTGRVYSQESRCAQSGSGVLRVLNGKCAGMMVSLESGYEYLVGRSTVDNHIQIPLETLSKAHFGLSYQRTKGRFIVWDNYSTNGSFFQSGERMIPGCRYAAFPGDIFYLADKECAIQMDVR